MALLIEARPEAHCDRGFGQDADKFTAVAELGVTLIEGDLDDPSSYEAGLKGADNVFVNADCECVLMPAEMKLRRASLAVLQGRQPPGGP